MKLGKAAGPDGVPVETWKVLGELGINWLTQFLNRITKEAEGRRFRMLQLPRDQTNLKHDEIYERLVDSRLREMVPISQVQWGFMPERSTTDAIVIARQVMDGRNENPATWHSWIWRRPTLMHLEAHNVISSDQHGFKKGRSQETALLASLNDWSKALDEKKRSDVVYFDFSKAFDKALVEKIALKIKPMIINWTLLFLSKRTYQVEVKEQYSEVLSVHSGVPQGDTLSLILFLLYSYELPAHITRLGSHARYKKIERAEGLISLQTLIDAISHWAEKWDLPLSAEKKHLLVIGRRCQTATQIYSINGEALNEVQEACDLGFEITNDLFINTAGFW
ncbi:unnamed protein product [Heligmosomoides polygyrus]|uniref:Reverse transcriptase domain-containing protein n=1 Tax=Heligmosomoides polygyrus TaxID=6339 RepID=A0A183FXL7_HELPZ|nr:unnamed protein product [Heligmosomoides polygyrus]